jgi:hypothetical protein
MKRLILIVTLALIWSVSFGQDFHEEVTKVFNFYPHKMSKEEQEVVFPILDKFFDMVTKDKNKYLEPLRQELKRNDNNPYFYFDGGLLLLEISQSKEDIQLAADALVKSDLRDIPPKIYLEHTLGLSLKGANVIDAALHILDDTTFTAFIPQHFLTLEYGKGLEFILPRYSPNLYIDKLISKFHQISSTSKKLTCLELFVYANCCEADNFLNSLTDNAQPKEVRDKIAEILKQTSVTRKHDEKKYVKLFEDRKKVLSRISDEAMYESVKITMNMRKAFKCDKK